MSTCQLCGGTILEMNKNYSFSGKVCVCPTARQCFNCNDLTLYPAGIKLQEENSALRADLKIEKEMNNHLTEVNSTLNAQVSVANARVNECERALAEATEVIEWYGKGYDYSPAKARAYLEKYPK